MAAKWSGAEKMWKLLDGWKTKIAAVLGIISGITGLMQEFLNVEGAHNFAALLTFAKGIPSDPMWLLIVGSLGLLGVGHKLDKAAE